MAVEVKEGMWPLPAFYFQVEIEDIGKMLFQEISGLDIEIQKMESGKHINLKKGRLKGTNQLYDWFGEIKMNIVKRRAVTIRLLDEDNNPTMVWKISNAWPVKIEGVILDPEGVESTIQSVELAYESISIG